MLSIGVAYGPCVFDTLPAKSLIVCTGICAVAPAPVELADCVVDVLPISTVPFVFATEVPGAKPERSSVAVQFAVAGALYQPLLRCGSG